MGIDSAYAAELLGSTGFDEIENQWGCGGYGTGPIQLHRQLKVQHEHPNSGE